jgi:hypothetical protein
MCRRSCGPLDGRLRCVPVQCWNGKARPAAGRPWRIGSGYCVACRLIWIGAVNVGPLRRCTGRAKPLQRCTINRAMWDPPWTVQIQYVAAICNRHWQLNMGPSMIDREGRGIDLPPGQVKKRDAHRTVPDAQVDGEIPIVRVGENAQGRCTLLRPSRCRSPRLFPRGCCLFRRSSQWPSCCRSARRGRAVQCSH